MGSWADCPQHRQPLSAEHLELRIKTGIVVHPDGQLPETDKVIHPQGGAEKTEKRGAFGWMQLQPDRNACGACSIEGIVDMLADFAAGVGPVSLQAMCSALKPKKINDGIDLVVTAKPV